MSSRTPDGDLIAARLDDIARLLALMVRGNRPLQEVIAEFSQVGFGASRIAELVGTSAGYVSVALTRARKKPTED